MLHTTGHKCTNYSHKSDVVDVANIKLETNPVGCLIEERNVPTCGSCSCKFKAGSLLNSSLLKHEIKQEVKIEPTNRIKLDEPDVFDEHTSIEVNDVQNILNDEPAPVFEPHKIGVYQNLGVGDKEPAEHTSSVGPTAPAVPNLHVSHPCLPSYSSELDSSNATLSAEVCISQNVNKVNGVVPIGENIYSCSNSDEASVSTCSNGVSEHRYRSSYVEKPVPCPWRGGDTAPAQQPALQESYDLRDLLNTARKRKLQHIEYPLNAELQRILKVNVIPGKYCNKKTYSRTVLVADKCFQPLSEIWSRTSEVIPDLIIKEDLKISDVEPIVNALINVTSKSNSKKMLIIVALRLNESWTFTPFKDCDYLNHESLQCITLLKNRITLKSLTTLQKKIEDKVDLLFAHVIPAGWHLIQRSLIALHAVLEGHKVFSTDLTGQTVLQAKSFIRYCSSVNSSLDENGLSSINGLPYWNLVQWEGSVINLHNCNLSNLPVQNNGKDLTYEALQTIALKVCELSLQYQTHSMCAIPPLVCNFSANPSLQAEAETRTFSKLVLITDAKLSLLDQKWPKQFSLQPEMQVSGVLKPSDLLKRLLATYDQTTETFFIICPSVRNLLLIQQVKECNDHIALKYPSCRTGVGQKGTVNNTVFQKIQELKSSILERFQKSCVALSTVHCIKFQMIFDNLCTRHQKETGHVISQLNEPSFIEKQTQSMQTGIDTLNELICKENKRSGLPSFDIFNFIEVNNSSNISKHMPDGMNLSEAAISILADKCIENLSKFNRNIFYQDQSVHLANETNQTIVSQDMMGTKEISDMVTGSEAAPSCEIPLLSIINSMPQWQPTQLNRGNHTMLHTAQVTNRINPQASEDCCKDSLLVHNNSVNSSEVSSMDCLSNHYETSNSVIQCDIQVENLNRSESQANNSNCNIRKSHKVPIPIESENSVGDKKHEKIALSTLYQSTSNLLQDQQDDCFSDVSEENNDTHKILDAECSNEASSAELSFDSSFSSSLTSKDSNVHGYSDISSLAEVTKPLNESPQVALHTTRNRHSETVTSSSPILKAFDNWYTFPNKTTAGETLNNRSHFLDLIDSSDKLPSSHQICSVGPEIIAQCCSNDLGTIGYLQPSFEGHHVLDISELRPNDSNHSLEDICQSPKNEHSVKYGQHSANYRRPSPRRDKQSPNLRKHSPESLSSSSKYRTSSNKRRPFPDYRYCSPEHRRHSPVYRACSLENSHSSEHRRLSCEYGRRSPEHRRRSPEHRRRSPQYRRRSPEYRHCSPDYRHRSPDYRHRSPDYRHRSPDYRHRTSDYRHSSPKSRRYSPDNRYRSAEQRRQSPEQRRQSPEHRRHSPEYFLFSKDRQHSAISSHLPAHHQPTSSRVTENLLHPLEGGSCSPISSNDSLLDVKRSSTKLSCSSRAKRSEIDQFPRSNDHAPDPMYPKKKMKKDNRSCTDLLKEKSDALKTRSNQYKESSPVGSHSSRCSVDSTGISRRLSRHNSETHHLDQKIKSSQDKKTSTTSGSSDHLGLCSLLRPMESSSYHTQARSKRPTSPGASFSANILIKNELRLDPRETARLETIALKSLRSFHEQDCEKYLKDPSTHPAYQDERRVFIESCLTSTRSSASDVEDFLSYWKNKLVKILEQTWHVRKERCLTMLRHLQSYCYPPANSKQQINGTDTINCDEKSLDSLKALRMKRKWKSKKRAKFVEQLKTGSINCKKSLELLNQLKFSNDELVMIILKESSLMAGDDGSSPIQSDPCDVLTTLRILSLMPETFESLSVSISMMLRTLLNQQHKLDFFLCSFSRYDKIFLKMAMCKLKEKKRNNLEEVQKVIVSEAHDRLEALLFRLLDYSDPFFGLNINTDIDAVEFDKIINFVYCETKDLLEGTSVGSIVIILLSMAVRSALTEESSILSSDETAILSTQHVVI